MKTKNLSSDGLSAEEKQALESLVKALEGGRDQEAVELFLKAQACEIFPRGPDTLKWLTDNIGKKDSTRLIRALTCLACFSCERGLRKCENCNGAGHFDYDMVCEACLGFGSISCDFCGGTGLASIDFIPIGLRSAVFAVRLEYAEKQIEALLAEPTTSSSAQDPKAAFSDCVDALFNLNRQISVLESAVGVSADLLEASNRLSKRLSRIARKAVRVGSKGEKRLMQIVACMVVACELQAKNTKESTERGKLARARKKFYGSLVNSRLPFAGTYLEHMPLTEAAEKLNSSRAVSHGA